MDSTVPSLILRAISSLDRDMSSSSLFNNSDATKFDDADFNQDSDASCVSFLLQAQFENLASPALDIDQFAPLKRGPSDVGTNEDMEKKVEEIIASISPTNMPLLQCIFSFLNRFQLHTESNHIDADKLSKIWAPLLFRFKDHKDTNSQFMDSLISATSLLILKPQLLMESSSSLCSSNCEVVASNSHADPSSTPSPRPSQHSTSTSQLPKITKVLSASDDVTKDLPSSSHSVRSVQTPSSAKADVNLCESALSRSNKLRNSADTPSASPSSSRRNRRLSSTRSVVVDSEEMPEVSTAALWQEIIRLRKEKKAMETEVERLKREASEERSRRSVVERDLEEFIMKVVSKKNKKNQQTNSDPATDHEEQPQRNSRTSGRRYVRERRNTILDLPASAQFFHFQ